MHFLNVIDTPTDNFSGASASVDIGNTFFNAPTFFIGVLVGIICCFIIKVVYSSIKKTKKFKDTQENDKKDE